jgi:4-amino-4-deoxy-L-arabinose transferase-like glycosyltransferase
VKLEQGDDWMNLRPQRVWVSMIVLLAASLAVRFAALAHWGTGAIESEGAEYARIAENLRNGVGFVGLVTPGPQLNFNPLYPLLIAAISVLTHSYEWAARLVCLVLGALLPLPVFGIASRLFNRRVGYIAAVLTLLHPVLVNLSFTTFSEGPYTTMLLVAAYLTVLAIPQISTKLWFLVGAAFGLAWFIRAEATAAFAIAVLFALWVTEGSLAVRCKRALVAVAVFVLMVLPEGIFIFKTTGKVRLEAKSIIFSYTGRRILAAETKPGVDFESPGGHHEVPSSVPNFGNWQRWEEKWAFYGIDSNLKGMGFPLRPHVEVVRETQVSLTETLRLFLKGLHLNTPELFRALSSDWFGSPFLPALALLGALRRPWRGPRTPKRLFILLIAVAPVLATFLALWTQARYYFALVPLLCIWAANGLFEMGLWMKATAIAAGWKSFSRSALFQFSVPLLVALVMMLSSVKGVRRLYMFTDSALPTLVEKQVGDWIGRQQDRPIKIMDTAIPLAFHADAKLFSYFPYCSGDFAIQYLDAGRVDYIVLRRGEHFTRYYEDWLTHGIPDQRAELLQLPSFPGADKFVVYRWHHREQGFSIEPRPAYGAFSSGPSQSVGGSAND